MSSEGAAVDPELHALVVSAVLAANREVRELEASNRFIGTYHDFPGEVTISKQGWPSVHMLTSGAPKDYGQPFGPSANDYFSVAYDDVPELSAMIQHVMSDSDLIERLDGEVGSSAIPLLREISAGQLATQILDQARHRFGVEPTPSQISAIYSEVEPFLTQDEVQVELLVPILGVRFDTSVDHYDMPGIGYIEKMTDATLRARARTPPGRAITNPSALQAATHAFVQGHNVPAREVRRLIYFPEFWSGFETVSSFFRSLELAADVKTGFGEVFMRPVGWTDEWRVDLPALRRLHSEKRYPVAFDEVPDFQSVEIVPKAVLDRITPVATAVKDAAGDLGLAIRRFGSARLRDRTDDRLLDLCIGLEALFGDHQEITHKLATRTAAALALTSQQTGLTSVDVSAAMKKVYGLRSKMVHGGNAAASTNWLADDGKEHDLVELADLFLRRAIAARIEHPSLNAPELDRLAMRALDTAPKLAARRSEE